MKHIFQPIQRRRIWICFRIVLLTYVAVVAQTSGLLTRLDHVLYDQRAALCQHFAPPPTRSLVHLDIDDTAVSQVGRWPWHRDVTAEILDEVRRAGPKVLAMDILFAEPEEIAYDKAGHEIDRDGILAATLRESGQVLAPCSFTFDPPARPDALTQRITALLHDDIELSFEQCLAKLPAQNRATPDFESRAQKAFLIARPVVIYEKIHRELAERGKAAALSRVWHAGAIAPMRWPVLRPIQPVRRELIADDFSAKLLLTLNSIPASAGDTRVGAGLTRASTGDAPVISEKASAAVASVPVSAGENSQNICSGTSKLDVKKKLFPHADAQFAGSVLDRLFEEEYDKATRERALYRFTLDLPPDLRNVLRADSQITPILCASAAAKFSAFVDYLPDHEDGTVRRVPLLASFRGRLVPYMGLATACALLDVDIHTLRIGPDNITLPRPGGNDIVIPTHTVERDGVGEVGYLMEVPMFGKSGDWTTMYDFPRHQQPAQHVSVYEVWRICQTRRRMASNDDGVNRVLALAFHAMDDDDKRASAFAAAPPANDTRRMLIETTAGEIHDLIDGLASVPDLGSPLKEKLADLKVYETDLRNYLKQSDALQHQLADLRADLRGKLNGKAIFLGGTATGNVDVVPTSLFAQCPGVVVHGAIVNAILTGRMFRVAPPWVTVMLTAAMALLIGIVASTFSPAKGFVAALALGGGYLLVNGLLLFDYGNWIVGAAGPAFAAVLAWSLITLFNFIAEATERARITRRFSSYVDPSLVNYVIKHPEHVRFTGERREMTMGFTDLAGFTTLTESLGPRTVPLLSEYMNLMIPTIREHKGYVSRLMGDGIYFFFGAPEEDKDHATHAVNTVLAMHAAMDRLNCTLPDRGFPTLTMRAGVCSGAVIVGDAGSNEFHDYTAVGDSVNTASRLESANKVFGTRSLVGARTIELLGGEFLSRPIANVRVAGKTKGVMVYEPLCPIADATEVQRRLSELSVQIVSAFQCANFDDCISAAEYLERQAGASKFAELYRNLATAHRAAPPDDFDGQMVLTEK